MALRELRQAEDALARHRAADSEPDVLTAGERDEFLAVGPELPRLATRCRADKTPSCNR